MNENFELELRNLKKRVEDLENQVQILTKNTDKKTIAKQINDEITTKMMQAGLGG